MQDLNTLLQNAFRFREALRLKTNALRLVNSQGDSLKGLIIDRFNKHFVVYMLDPYWQSQERAIREAISEHYEVDYLVFKDHSIRDAAQITSHVLIEKKDSKTIVEENGLHFQVDLNDHLNQGLFLDMRKNRQQVASQARGKTVLNCFAYTCSFGVYCRALGASRVTNVDISAKYLQKGVENYQLNHLSENSGEFVREDVARYLERIAKRQRFFDVVILDPPSFSRSGNKVFSVKKDMPGLIEKSLDILNPQGMLFVATNLSLISLAKLEEWIKQAANQRKGKILKMTRLTQDVDFRGSGSMKESFLSAILIRIK